MKYTTALIILLAFSAGCLADFSIKDPAAEDYIIGEDTPDYQRECQSQYAQTMEDVCAKADDRNDCVLKAKDQMINCLTQKLDEIIKARPDPYCWPGEEDEKS